MKVENQSTQHRLAIRLLALSIPTLLLLAGLEIIVRIYQGFYPEYKLFDPAIGFRYTPNTSVVKHNDESNRHIKLDINQDGFRDINHSLEKPEGVKRIAIHGDSFVAAVQVNFEDTFHQILQQNLNRKNDEKWQVMNFGVNGFSTAQSFKVMQDYSLKYSPDLVILCFFLGNDIGENVPSLSRKGRIFYDLKEGGAHLDEPQLAENIYTPWLKWSALYRATRRELDRLIRKYQHRRRDEALVHRYNVFRSKPSAEWEIAWQVTEALLVNMKNRLKSEGRQFLLVVIPDAIQVNEDLWNNVMAQTNNELSEQFNPHIPLDRIREISRRNNIETLDLYPLLLSLIKNQSQPLYFGRAHFTEHGHEVIADALFRTINSSIQ